MHINVNVDIDNIKLRYIILTVKGNNAGLLANDNIIPDDSVNINIINDITAIVSAIVLRSL